MRLILSLAAAFVMLAAGSAGAQTTDRQNLLDLQLTTGKVVIRLRPDLAPNHVARVKELVRRGFYDGTPFHRVIEGFMAQGGARDPEAADSGTGLPPLKAEFTPTPFIRGTVGAARTSDPNSANSQFYIMFAPAPHLNGKYTVWGEVISGMEFVDKIKRGEPPANPDKIIHAQIEADSK
jgi:cyclophilin family peptidyl-prolyl cis-trans isomerase